MSDTVTEMAVRGRSFILAADEDVEALKHRIEVAAERGQFVEFSANGCDISLLISPGSDVIITCEIVTTVFTGDQEGVPSLGDGFDY